VLYLLSKFFPSRIGKKLMICDLFWCRMNLVRRFLVCGKACKRTWLGVLKFRTLEGILLMR
jgi:hypothetical protein